LEWTRRVLYLSGMGKRKGVEVSLYSLLSASDLPVNQ
jgi:hypothetical protein